MQTGGGPPLDSPKEFIKEIINQNSESEQFTGIDGGMEAGTDFGLFTDSAAVSNDEGSETIIDEGNKLTVLEDIEILHPINVNVDIVRKIKDDKSDILGQENILYNENQKQKIRKVTQKMVWEVQLQYFQEQTATEIRRRQLKEVKENFSKTATAELKKSEVSDIFKIFNANKEQ